MSEIVGLAARDVYVGERLSNVGVLVACEPGRGPIRGLCVRAEGNLVVREIVVGLRVRARPWSARLAPWEASRWEHRLERRTDGAFEAVLDGVRVRERIGPKHRVASSGWAVWVEITGDVAREGSGALEWTVSAHEGAGTVRARIEIRARETRPPEVLVARGRWTGTLVDHAREVRHVLDATGAALASLPRGERVLVARGTALDRLYLRPGCVVLSSHGLSGDPRWRALCRRLGAGAVERIELTPPDGSPRGEEAFEISVRNRVRFHPGPIEVTAIVGRGWIPESHREAFASRLREVFRAHRAEEVTVFEHPWVPDVGAIGAPTRVM